MLHTNLVVMVSPVLEEAAALGDVAKRVAPADRRALPPVHVRELVQQVRPGSRVTVWC